MKCKYDTFCEREDKATHDCTDYQNCDLYALQEVFSNSIHTPPPKLYPHLNEFFVEELLRQKWRLN